MPEHASSSRPGCILAVSGDPHRFDALLDAVPDVQPLWRSFARCPEAAARLARQGAELLVVDTRILGKGQLPLLRIARREGVAMAALGPTPMGLDESDIGDLERLDDKRLIEKIRGLLGLEACREAGDDPADASQHPPAAATDSAPEDFQGQDPQPPATRSETPGHDDAPAPPEREELSDEDLPDALCRELEDDAPDLSPSRVLSPEELAALLEDRS